MLNKNKFRSSWRGACVVLVFSLQSACLVRSSAEPEAAPITEPEPAPVTEPVAAETQFNELKIEAVPDSDISQPLVPVEPVEPDYDRADVLWIQQRLQDLGYYSGSVDGSAGEGTRTAIRDYQTDQDLETDGRPTAEFRDYMWRNGG
jgi:hypothetical protein